MSVFAAAALVVLKLGTGLLTGSLGLVSAGIESSGDVVAAKYNDGNEAARLALAQRLSAAMSQSIGRL